MSEKIQETPEIDEMVESKPKIPKKMASLQQEYKAQIITLRGFCAGLFLALIITIVSLANVSNDIIVHIPPNMSEGVTMNAGDYPRANVLTNTSAIWISVNTWMENGEKDAEKNIQLYANYMSRSFMNDLRQILSKRSLDRQRRLTMAPGMLAEFDKRVVQINKHSWVVYLDMIEEEWYLGERVRHSKIRYPIIAEQVTSTFENNPIELELVGFYSPPTVVEEM